MAIGPNKLEIFFNPQKAFQQASQNGEALVPSLKQVSQNFSHQCEAAFQKYPIQSILNFRAQYTDWLLLTFWEKDISLEPESFSVIALGGYGRGELHPYSDIDLLFLFHKRPSDELAEQISQFLTGLWDLKLTIGHSVRTLDETKNDMQSDIVFMTSLMESRLLFGDKTLYGDLECLIHDEKIWPPDLFFIEKYQERKARHYRYDDTAYKLEPNIKKSPGGLRELQVLSWVTQRTFNSQDLNCLIEQKFLSTEEYNELQKSYEFLNKVRFALHREAKKAEDRLLFDHQNAVAEFLGYQGDNQKELIESLMQEYYKTVMQIREISDIVLAFFMESFQKENIEAKILSEDFEQIGQAIAIRDAGVFANKPEVFLTLFLMIADKPEITSITPQTMRLIRTNRERIDESFRENKKHNQLFLELLRHPKGVRQLRLMKSLGVLGRYIPELLQVTGQMQFDLFHIYTVDEHTLFVVQNAEQFGHDNLSKEFHQNYPLCHDIFTSLEKPECLYIAALFHDIAKGRGGDHSKLGAVDVERFCKRLALGAYETRLIAWLVKEHLLMSVTAQKKDISDPYVISEFAAKVRDQIHLDYLYLLTCADISATNKVLWNHWKAALMRDLHQRTTAQLAKGLESLPDKRRLIRETKLDAMALLENKGLSLKEVLSVWHLLHDDYFLKQSAEDIAWQSLAIAEHGDSREPLVEVRQLPSGGATEILVYCPDQAFLFGRMAEALHRMGVNVLSAAIMGSKNHFALDTYVVLDVNSGQAITDLERIKRIEESLFEQLKFNDRCIVDVNRKIPLKVRQFSIPTEVTFSQDEQHQQTIIEVTSLDRPGLLAHIGNVFYEHGVVLESAKIMTIGEKVEDSFYIKDTDDKPIVDSALQEAIAEDIKKVDSL